MKKHLFIFCLFLSCITLNSIAQVNYQWVKTAGSIATEKGKGVAVDIQGNVYITGQFGGNADFNLYGNSPVDITKTGIFSGFIAKYDSNGNNVLAIPLYPASTSDLASGTSIAVDISGNIYVTGFFIGTVDFDPSLVNTSLTSNNGSFDVFIAKYTTLGDLSWVKKLGGSNTDFASSIAVDASGNVYSTGTYSGNDFIAEGGTIQLNSGLSDVYLTKYDNAGAHQWTNTIGGPNVDLASCIALDKTGNNVYLTGTFRDTADFNPSASIDTLSSAGNNDVFFAKYTSGGTYVWAKRAGGTGVDGGTGIVLDTANNIYLTGIYQGAADFGYTNIPAPQGFQSVFVAKCDNSGTFVWAKHIESLTSGDSVLSTSIAVDSLGSIYLTGLFSGDMDTDPLGFNDIKNSAGEEDLFFAKYLTDGTYKWSKTLGSSGKDAGSGIAVHNAENVFLTGYFEETVNFDPSAGTANRISKGAEDVFIEKFRQGTSTISGIVTHDGYTLPVNAGQVKLFSQTPNDGNAVMHLMAATELDAQGNYSFSDLCNGDYLVLTLPNDTTFPATFYGNTAHWQAATHIITTLNSTHTANISMAEAVPNGNATLSGTVYKSEGYDRTTGTPLSGTPVGLEGEPGGITVSQTHTNENGYYEFSKVPAGCYRVYINIPGLPMDSTYHECPTALDTVVNLDFVADSSGINIIPATTTVEQISSLQPQMQIYPNPHKGIAVIEFTVIKPSKVQISVYNLLGEKVADLMNEQKQAGVVKCRINTIDKGLKAGVYILSLAIGDQMSTKKIVQIE
ncbi:MAG: SBBP repeat-containing protein [Bacteroidota bacterium]